MKAKRAFTLIELLVVIAIIAILAAILFPVFAQAKEAAKKAATLSNFKQIGTAIQIYLGDSDDRFPKTFGKDTTANLERWDAYHRVPQDWDNTAPFNTAQRRDEDGQFWANSISPYVKNIDMYQQQGMATTVNVSFANAVKPRAKMGMTMNGMLHTWSSTVVADSAKLPLVWAGLWKQNRDGVARSSPTLICDVTPAGPCIFTPGACPQAGTSANCAAANGYGYAWWGFATPTAMFTTWIYGRGMIFVGADTNAKHRTLNAPLVPGAAMNTNDNPWSQFDPAGAPGAPYWMTDCVTPGANHTTSSEVFYPGYFRPDSDFAWDDTECSISATDLP